ncbi:hypothetical protein I3843_02G088500 [Carya illinoinensis]|nr:hypothetical protein I3843_02G088500 [Carya illinoinensis]
MPVYAHSAIRTCFISLRSLPLFRLSQIDVGPSAATHSSASNKQSTFLTLTKMDCTSNCICILRGKQF